MTKFNFLTLLLVFIFISTRSFSQLIITSFEEERDFSSIQATSGVEVSRSVDFPALGHYSCKAIFPKKGGSISFPFTETASENIIESSSAAKKDILHLFAWSNELAEIELTLKDSSNQSFISKYSIEQGANHLQMRLADVKNMDLKRIISIGLRTKKEHIFYLDYIALDQYQPVLENLGRWDVPYSTDIKTPHFPWGTDLANGTIKSYSIAPVFDGRGIIELAERLDLDIKVSTIGRNVGAEKYGYGDFYMRRSTGYTGDNSSYNMAKNYIADDLLFGPEYDVIIWPGIHKWESYPEPVRNAVMDRVKDGAGLVLLFPISYDEHMDDLWSISPLKSSKAAGAQSKIKDREMSSWPAELDSSIWLKTNTHFITRGVLTEAFPWGHIGAIPYENNHGDVLLETANGNPVLAVRNFGKGRVVGVSYPERGFLPRVDNPWETGLHYPYWEYMWSLVARSVVWASQRESEFEIIEASRSTDGLRINMGTTPNEATLHIQVSDEFGGIEEEKNVLVRQGMKQVDIKLGNNLHGGKHLVNIQLIGEKGIYDWYSLMFETDKIGEIAAVENRKSEIPVGENVQPTIILKSKNLVHGRLTTQLYDNYGRLVDQHIQAVSVQGEQSYGAILKSENILTNLATVDVLFHVDGNQVDRKVKEVFFLQPRLWDDYDVTMYHFGPNPVPGTWTAVDQQLQEMNVTTLAAYTLENSKHANYKVQAQTRINGVESPDSGPDLDYYKEMKIKYLESKDKSVLRRKYGLKDTLYLNSVRDDLTTMVGDWKKFSPSAYYIYEEPSVTRYDDALDLCFRESTMDAMHIWLKAEYGSLKALNEQWGTDFSQWPDVIPDDTREARERGNYSSWADHRTFMEILWADQFKFVQDIVNEIDPGGLVQLSGTQAASSHNGYDYSRLNKYIGQMNPYDIDNQLEYHHNFNPDLKVSGQAGYGALGKGVLYDYYHHLFLKETGGAYVFWQASSLNPDLRMCQAGTDMKKGFDELLKRGIGRLISSYDPENELRIAVHFSYPSVHAAWIVDGEIIPQMNDNNSATLKQYNRNRDGWVKLLHDYGFGFDFISYRSIEKGGLQQDGYKVLILPMSYALSDKEVMQIEQFVEQGGIVIADALAGVMDNHTRFRSKRALSEVFGIKAKGFVREDLITPDHESKLKVKKAEILLKEDNKSELLYNIYGEGSAYLLNYLMDDYPDQKLSGNNESSLLKIKTLFDREKLTSGIKLTKHTGEAANGIEKYSFSEENSSVRLLGLLPGKNGNNEEINLHINQPVHLYDIRNKKYMGEGKDFKISLETTVPELFGLVPGKIDEMEVKAPASIVPGDKVELHFRLIGSDISSLKSVVRVDVFDPDGQTINYYSKNCDIVDGMGSYSFDLALNEKPGNWIIKVTEVISNIENQVSISVN